VQIPVPWIGWHVASPHSASPARRDASSVDAEQIRAHDLPPDDILRAHCGSAVTPDGTSVGHDELVQFGEQNAPEIPVTLTASSSSSQPSAGFP
jgi:hypothetical protein